MQYIYLISKDYFIALRLLFHVSEDFMEFLILLHLKFKWKSVIVFSLL